MTVDDVTEQGTGRRTERISAKALWFGVAGGVAAWTVHLFVAWSFMEESCLAPRDSEVLQQGGAPGTTVRAVVYAATALPWLTALLAFLTCLLLWRRLHRLDSGELAGERTSLLLVIGMFLDLMAVAAITAGGISLLVLEPCR